MMKNLPIDYSRVQKLKIELLANHLSKTYKILTDTCYVLSVTLGLHGRSQNGLMAEIAVKRLKS